MATQTKNRFLLALCAATRERVLAKSTLVELPIKQVLYRAEETPRYIHFLETGMASVVVTMENGVSAEVNVIGSEGLVGSLSLLGPSLNPTNSFIQLAGEGYRIPLSDLSRMYRETEELRDRVLEFVQVQAMITSQVAGCNRLHEVEERLARWLLVAQDLTGLSDMQFTQEFLAIMLGSQRTTVTVIAGIFQRSGLIEYTRGRVTILDRARLESTACTCYRVSHMLNQNLYSGHPHSNGVVLKAMDVEDAQASS